MAKSKSFFGLRRGSTKTLTFSVFNGQQVTKDRVESVKNPRSPAQMVQRMCMATASAAYAQMKEIVDHSFEGVTYGLDTMSEFIRQNVKQIKASASKPANAVFAFNPYQDRNLYGGAFIMSAGTAGVIPEGSTKAWAGEDDIVFLAFGTVEQGVAPTADSIYDSLRIREGEMCTICFIAEDNTNATGKFGFVRIKAKESGNVPLTKDNYSTYFDVESNLSIDMLSMSDGRASFRVHVPNVVQNSPVQFCAIHSVKALKGWLRSNAVMKVGDYTLAPGFEDAIATYPVGDSFVLNGGDIQ